MNLSEVNVGEEYRIKDIVAEDEELKAFLFSLGCYSGEPITVIDRKRSVCVVSIKDARYCIDKALATTILVQTLFFMADSQLILTDEIG